jgi:hypothetical protein
MEISGKDKPEIYFFLPVYVYPEMENSARALRLRGHVISLGLPLQHANPCAMASGAFKPVSISPISFVSASCASIGKKLQFPGSGYIQ